jgi:hypothetical protein
MKTMTLGVAAMDAFSYSDAEFGEEILDMIDRVVN